MRPLFTISGFEHGILEDITTPASNGFNFGAGVDIHREPGILQLSQRPTVMLPWSSGTSTYLSRYLGAMVNYGNSGTIYAYEGVTNYIYVSNSGFSVSWGTIHAVPGSYGGGMTEFNNKIYWCTTTNIGSFDGATWTDSVGILTVGSSAPTISGGGFHTMIGYGTKLCVADGHNLFTLDTDGISNGSALVFPSGESIRSLEVYGGLLYLGTIKNSVDCTLYSWDGFSPEAEPVLKLKEKGIRALRVWNNYLWIFAGLSGNIYRFNGASLSKLTVPYVSTLASSGVSNADVYPSAVVEHKGNLVFGLSNSVQAWAGIYSIGQKSDSQPMALTLSHLTSSKGTTNMTFYSLASYSENNVFVSYREESSGTYFVEQTGSDNRTASGAFVDSQMYDVSVEDQKRQIKGVEVVARPLSSSDYINVQYKKDNGESWTNLGNITSVNQGDVLFGQMGLAKTLQIKLNLVAGTSSGGTSIMISSVKVY